MPEAVIVSALRTPIGTARKGTLRDTTAFDLAEHVIKAAAEGLDPERVDDVIMAEGLAGGSQLALASDGLDPRNVPAQAANLLQALGLSHVELELQLEQLIAEFVLLLTKLFGRQVPYFFGFHNLLSVPAV